MATETYDSLCNELYEKIYRKLERTEDERLRFVPRRTAKRILQDDDNKYLKRFFHSLATPGLTSPDIFHISDAAFVERVKARKLFDFLGTLVFATCSVHAARTFAEKLVAADDSVWLAQDAQKKPMGVLPANRAQLEELFGSVVDADKFSTKQGCFCAVVLVNKKEVNIEDLDCQRLPYLEETPIGEGAFGKVFRVTVAEGHFRDDSDPAFPYNVKPKALARKDYVIANRSNAKEEYAIMGQILNSTSRKCENIVESLGCLEIGSSYSLFMPLAICDLRAYMMNNHYNRPQTKEARADIILCAAGLASGLDFLHNDIKNAELDDLVCYHMDLNPGNVLVFQENTSDGRIRTVWKLSDFGMARVKIRRHGHGAIKETDFNSLFVRRKRAQEPSASATVNRRGEGTYLPPESLSSKASMRTSSDVWALGCVISVVLTYLEAGAEGVTRYQDARMEHRRAEHHDGFFLRGTRFDRAELHPQVRAWHKELKVKVAKRNATEGRAVSTILDFLENSVLKIDQDRRCSAKSVKLKLEETFRMYRSAEDPRRDSILPPVSISPRQYSNPNVDEWYPSSSEDFKGCAISPDANVLAYWTDAKIALYTSQCLLKAKEGRTVGWENDWSLNERDCFLKTICLTNKYLIASTTGRNLLYIFNLEGGLAVDYNLNSVRRLVLRLPAIHKTAISPDSKNLVFVARNYTNERGPGILFYSSMSDLISFIDTAPRPRSPNDNTGRKESIPVTLDMRWLQSIKIDWPAEDVAHLSLSNDNDVYLVVRPELTAMSKKHKIPITRVSLDNLTMHTLNIESQGFDGGATTGLFTTFCPFANKDTCAVVTREKRFHIQKFHGTDASLELQRDIPVYRIIRLLTSCPGGRLLAVGTVQARHKLLLLEIQDFSLSSKTSVRQLASLPGLSYGDDFAAVLSDGGDSDQCVVVASLTGASRRIIYKVKLPPIEPAQ